MRLYIHKMYTYQLSLNISLYVLDIKMLNFMMKAL